MAQRGMTEEEKEVCQMLLSMVGWARGKLNTMIENQVFMRNITLQPGMFIVNFHVLLFRN